MIDFDGLGRADLNLADWLADQAAALAIILARMNDKVIELRLPSDELPPLYSQRDPRWQGERLGHGNTTIGQYGCVITSLAMAASHAAGTEITPLQVNLLMKDTPGAFTGPNGNLVVWSKIPQALPWLEFVDLAYCKNGPAPIAGIRAALEVGQYIVAMADWQPGGEVNQHWCLFTGLTADGFKLNDPWDGQAHTLPPAYCRSGWDAARAIFAVVSYRRAQNGGMT